MKKIRLTLVAALFIFGLASCVNDEFKEIEETEIRLEQSTEGGSSEKDKPNGNSDDVGG